MQYLVLLLATVALLSQSQTSCKAARINSPFAILNDLAEDNSLDGKALPLPIRRYIKKFAYIKTRPPQSTSHVAGTVLELPCQAIGGPAPSIQWFRNDEPILDHGLDSSEIIESPSSSIGQMRSTLLVTNPSPNKVDVYTCLVTAGRNTAVAKTTVFNIESNSIISERQKLLPLAPKIVVIYDVYADTRGQNVVLPCNVKGHPRPLVEWFDTDGVLIENRSRMKVLKSGELLITNLRWADMGIFRCQATNVFGITSRSTFLYPITEEL